MVTPAPSDVTVEKEYLALEGQNGTTLLEADFSRSSNLIALARSCNNMTLASEAPVEVSTIRKAGKAVKAFGDVLNKEFSQRIKEAKRFEKFYRGLADDMQSNIKDMEGVQEVIRQSNTAPDSKLNKILSDADYVEASFQGFPPDGHFPSVFFCDVKYIVDYLKNFVNVDSPL
jgi:hypothetical protein